MNGNDARVVVECFGVQMAGGDIDGGAPALSARYTHGERTEHPDIDAARMIGLIGSDLDGVAVLHSTSWRFDPAHGVILTYVCCPDPCPDTAGRLVAASAGHGTDDTENPSRPHDPRADLSDVLHHGIDHLAWLDDHHRHLTQRAALVAPVVWAAIRKAGRHRGGQRHHSTDSPRADVTAVAISQTDVSIGSLSSPGR